MKIEKLESRRLFNAAVLSAVPDVSGGVTSVDLSSHFKDANTYVRFDFGNGSVIDMEMRDQVTPNTVANFLNYVNSGEYNNTFIHRAIPGFIVQGGGYNIASPTQHIATGAPVTSEFSRENNGHPVNVRGTVAMALSSGDQNSATSEWFISLADNSSNLDLQNNGFTVFADVIGNGTSLADSIAALPNPQPGTTPYDNLPLVNYTSGAAVTTSNLVVINTASVIPGTLTFTATTDNTNVVRSTVTGGTLTLAYPGTGSGTAHVTVTATSLDGSTVSSTFTVNRADINPPTAAVTGPSVAADNSSFTFTVAYKDNVAVNASSIDNNDILVSGPHGYSQLATLISSGLVSGATVTATYKVTAPSGIFSTANGGTFTFAAQSNQVTDTTGNPLAAGSIGALNAQFVAVGSRPDLVGSIKAIKPSALVPGAKSNAATVTVRNKGITAAKGNVAVNLYASQDGTLAGAIFLGTKNVKLNLSKGQAQDVPFTYKTPVVSAAGNYHLVAFVDALSQLDEANENKNLAVGGVVKIAPPTVDLKVTLGKLPTTITSGKKTTIPVTIKNNGNVEARGNTVIKIAASADQTADAGDPVLITLPTKIDLKPGGSATLSVTFTPNKSIAPKGREFVGAQAIFNGSPADANPLDNVVFSTKTILFG
jgi:cyclophilin family peptidyl-prolyl cis-trans isomerase